MMKYCEWKGTQLPCSAIFKTSPTDRGMCCTFNLRAAEEMFKDKEYGVSQGDKVVGVLFVVLLITRIKKIYE